MIGALVGGCAAVERRPLQTTERTGHPAEQNGRAQPRMAVLQKAKSKAKAADRSGVESTGWLEKWRG